MNYKNIEIKWLGHASIMLKSNGIVVYIDPYEINPKEKADYIFITHSHYDHCSIEDIKKIIKNETKIICTADVQSKLRYVSDNPNAIIIEPDFKADYGRLKFWTIRAYNTNKTAHTLEEDWVGYIIQLDDILVYHAGDTDLIPEMKKLSNSKIELAFLPIGGTYTMNAGEASKAAALIKPKIAIPIHFGSIVGTEENARQFLKLCSIEGIEAKILQKEN